MVHTKVQLDNFVHGTVSEICVTGFEFDEVMTLIDQYGIKTESMQDAPDGSEIIITKEIDSMTDQYNTRLVTGEVRFSYANLLTPRTENGDTEPKYSTVVLLPKSDVDTKQRIDFAIQQAIEEGRVGKWNGVVPPTVATPVYDGDGVRQNGMPFGEECRGHWVFTAKTNAKYPLNIVDLGFNPIITPTDIYSGMYGRIAVDFKAYDHAGRKGIGCYISTNVQKTRDGEPLAGSAPAAADDFGGAAQAQAPYGQPAQQNYQQQPAQQSYAPPTQAAPAPAPQAPYGQPAPQNYQQQPPAQAAPQAPATQFDPNPGQPINYGYNGQ